MVSKRLFLKNISDIITLYKNRIPTVVIFDIQANIESIKNQQNRLDTLLHQKKKLSLKIANSDLSDGDKKQFSLKSSSLSPKINILKKTLKVLNQELEQQMLLLPNIPDKDVPIGNKSDQNTIYKPCGEKPDFDFKPKTHWQLDKTLKLINAKVGSEMADHRFSVLNPNAALLERALINFMLDTHTQEFQYQEMGLPLLVNENSLISSGHFPKFTGQVYTTMSGLSLIPTAEVPLVNVFSNEKLKEAQLPIKMVAQTHCFRKEAGTYGKKDKGYIRQHQFQKVELVQLVSPKNASDALRTLLGHAETIVQRLGLPYRIVELCAGELGFSAAKGFDIEVWFPGSNQFVEVSSCSNCTDFQAKRANIKYKAVKTKKHSYINTLNGSGLAVGRIVLAILENFQQVDGTVIIPEALFPYMKGLTKLDAKT